MTDVTRILADIERGEHAATDKLLTLVYDELRSMAAAKLADERPDLTLQATALVHEAYLRLVDTEKTQDWDSRAHFFAAVGESMRRILVDHARRKKRPKHGGDRQKLPLEDVDLATDRHVEELLMVHELLDELANVDGQAAQIVKLRYFAGFRIEEAAEILGLSNRTAYRDWAFARAWLRRRAEDLGATNAD